VPSADVHDDAAVVVSAASRALRRQLRPLVWVTLEEVALDAVVEGGRLLARTSARQVAERLGVDPGTAAGALRALRRRGLLALERKQGPAGRFGLSVYILGPIAGLTVLKPGAKGPRIPGPPLVSSSAEEPASGAPLGFVPPQSDHPGVDGPRAALSHTVGCPGTPYPTDAEVAEHDSPQRRARPLPPSPPCPGQMPLDLGLASS
jgi:DNA-binding transcriptional ArsR family regulator